ncbi:unnamed protein product [Protopolystoma xenopodis]|uniref:Uncharacterized protein n=1 Tax=Protopolystoma xenopodis TaxID=117903 RepID=A0A448XEV4_9PLAT|nr:unnamed protein product [Protopolystoma xenopodis]
MAHYHRGLVYLLNDQLREAEVAFSNAIELEHHPPLDSLNLTPVNQDPSIWLARGVVRHLLHERNEGKDGKLAPTNCGWLEAALADIDMAQSLLGTWPQYSGKASSKSTEFLREGTVETPENPVKGGLTRCRTQLGLCPWASIHFNRAQILMELGLLHKADEELTKGKSALNIIL